ncbi:hypothetical protein F5B22DRAFT_635731 [Xylaria bambusicola]|uniref:uncharacterized protein n=1 Tax=Xylaria bambusicola TaxID=326684 RepID=UPI0020087D52|nr:uncharacterized protein F5B22DRAFT_635731 [Xylaria bambusicola]KAI0517891.1 hypothetical protein F5B22DRAFT_635731 [Xylaria bambusicola]
MSTMELSGLTDEFDWNSTMGTTARFMRDTGFETWGFLVYRCAYGDDEAWNRYMEAFKEQVHSTLEYYGRDHLLEQYAQWTVVEDEETLNGASKQQVRERFVQWRDQHGVSRELSEAATIARQSAFWATHESTLLPRFTYCLYVDQKCLDTLKRYSAAKASGAGRTDWPVIVMIDGDYVPGGQYTHPHRRYPEVEGCTDEYVGWQYVTAGCVPTRYDALHYERMDLGGDFERPPAVYPFCEEPMP